MKYGKILALGAIVLSPVAEAAYVAGVKTTITGIDTYHVSPAEGDVRILTANRVAGCESGYVITADNAGIDRGLSLALAAYVSGRSVIIGGQSGFAWSATSRTDYCRVHAISFAD